MNQWRVVECDADGAEVTFRRRGQSQSGVLYLLSSLFCPIYDHNSFQHHYGNWEAIISEQSPKWCLNTKTVMKGKKSCWKNTVDFAGRRGMKKQKYKRWFLIVHAERLDQLSIEKVQFGTLDNLRAIILETINKRQSVTPNEGVIGSTLANKGWSSFVKT